MFSRTTPIVIGDELWYGANSNLVDPFAPLRSPPGPAPVAAAIPFVLNRHTGATVWVGSSLDDFFGSIVTGSPRYVKEKNLLIWGVSSNEETFAYYTNPITAIPYFCCSFSGSIVAMHVSTRTRAWKVYTTTFPTQTIGSRPVGYPNVTLPFSGAANWVRRLSWIFCTYCHIIFAVVFYGYQASGPAVNLHAGPFGHGLVYVGTGNNYLVPAVLQTCVNNVAATCGTNGTCIAFGNLACYSLYQIPQNLA